MAETKFPYAVAVAAMGEFLGKLRTFGVPDKIDYPYLRQVGYSSSNHRAFIPVMKHIGLLDKQGAPTNIYLKGLRGGEPGKRLVAQGIKDAYPDLFKTYPHAERASSSDLKTFMSAHSTLGDRALQSAVATFHAVCKFGDFSDNGAVGFDDEEEVEEKTPETGSKVHNGRRDRGGSGGGGGNSGNSVTINVNIALSVDATSDPAVYDAFFAAMAKHIKVLDGSPSHPA